MESKIYTQQKLAKKRERKGMGKEFGEKKQFFEYLFSPCFLYQKFSWIFPNYPCKMCWCQKKKSGYWIQIKILFVQSILKICRNVYGIRCCTCAKWLSRPTICPTDQTLRRCAREAHRQWSDEVGECWPNWWHQLRTPSLAHRANVWLKN